MRGITITCLAAIGCANNVPQDRMTGPDGRVKGAKPITLENGEANVKGVVTYPGGDRVDWKVIELPAGKKGRLDFAMQWTTPRPGLQLAFDVFDQYQHPVANAKGKQGRLRDAVVSDASGKYFVRVYAKGRGDAGAYKLAVAFKEEVAPPVPGPIVVADPPRLPDVPGPPCEPFDRTDPECKHVCPPGGKGAPPNWKPCIDSGEQVAPPAPPPVVVVPPPPPPKPVAARVLKADISGNDTVIIIGAGSDAGIDRTWKGKILRGATQEPLIGGSFTIFRVEKTRTYAKVQLTTDVVTANLNVVLQP